MMVGEAEGGGGSASSATPPVGAVDVPTTPGEGGSVAAARHVADLVVAEWRKRRRTGGGLSSSDGGVEGSKDDFEEKAPTKAATSFSAEETNLLKQDVIQICVHQRNDSPPEPQTLQRLCKTYCTDYDVRYFKGLGWMVHTADLICKDTTRATTPSTRSRAISEQHRVEGPPSKVSPLEFLDAFRNLFTLKFTGDESDESSFSTSSASRVSLLHSTVLSYHNPWLACHLRTLQVRPADYVFPWLSLALCLPGETSRPLGGAKGTSAAKASVAATAEKQKTAELLPDEQKFNVAAAVQIWKSIAASLEPSALSFLSLAILQKHERKISCQIHKEEARQVLSSFHLSSVSEAKDLWTAATALAAKTPSTFAQAYALLALNHQQPRPPPLPATERISSSTAKVTAEVGTEGGVGESATTEEAEARKGEEALEGGEKKEVREDEVEPAVEQRSPESFQSSGSAVPAVVGQGPDSGESGDTKLPAATDGDATLPTDSDNKDQQEGETKKPSGGDMVSSGGDREALLVDEEGAVTEARTARGDEAALVAGGEKQSRNLPTEKGRRASGDRSGPSGASAGVLWRAFASTAGSSGGSEALCLPTGPLEVISILRMRLRARQILKRYAAIKKAEASSSAESARRNGGATPAVPADDDIVGDRPPPHPPAVGDVKTTVSDEEDKDTSAECLGKDKEVQQQRDSEDVAAEASTADKPGGTERLRSPTEKSDSEEVGLAAKAALNAEQHARPVSDAVHDSPHHEQEQQRREATSGSSESAGPGERRLKLVTAAGGVLRALGVQLAPHRWSTAPLNGKMASSGDRRANSDDTGRRFDERHIMSSLQTLLTSWEVVVFDCRQLNKTPLDGDSHVDDSDDADGAVGNLTTPSSGGLSSARSRRRSERKQRNGGQFELKGAVRCADALKDGREADNFLLRCEQVRGKVCCLFAESDQQSEKLVHVATLLKMNGYPRLCIIVGGWKAFLAELESAKLSSQLVQPRSIPQPIANTVLEVLAEPFQDFNSAEALDQVREQWKSFSQSAVERSKEVSQSFKTFWHQRRHASTAAPLDVLEEAEFQAAMMKTGDDNEDGHDQKTPMDGSRTRPKAAEALEAVKERWNNFSKVAAQKTTEFSTSFKMAVDAERQSVGSTWGIRQKPPPPSDGLSSSHSPNASAATAAAAGFDSPNIVRPPSSATAPAFGAAFGGVSSFAAVGAAAAQSASSAESTAHATDTTVSNGSRVGESVAEVSAIGAEEKSREARSKKSSEGPPGGTAASIFEIGGLSDDDGLSLDDDDDDDEDADGDEEDNSKKKKLPEGGGKGRKAALAAGNGSDGNEDGVGGTNRGDAKVTAKGDAADVLLMMRSHQKEIARLRNLASGSAIDLADLQKRIGNVQIFGAWRVTSTTSAADTATAQQPGGSVGQGFQQLLQRNRIVMKPRFIVLCLNMILIVSRKSRAQHDNPADTPQHGEPKPSAATAAGRPPPPPPPPPPPEDASGAKWQSWGQSWLSKMSEGVKHIQHQSKEMLESFGQAEMSPSQLGEWTAADLEGSLTFPPGTVEECQVEGNYLLRQLGKMQYQDTAPDRIMMTFVGGGGEEFVGIFHLPGHRQFNRAVHAQFSALNADLKVTITDKGNRKPPPPTAK